MATDLTLEEAPFGLAHDPWGPLSLDAAMIRLGSEVSAPSWVNFMGRWGGAAWADPGCPAVHCNNCGCISPFCAWLDGSTQDFRLASYGNEALSCSRVGASVFLLGEKQPCMHAKASSSKILQRGNGLKDVMSWQG